MRRIPGHAPFSHRNIKARSRSFAHGPAPTARAWTAAHVFAAALHATHYQERTVCAPQYKGAEPLACAWPRAARSCPGSCTCICRCIDMRHIARNAPFMHCNIKSAELCSFAWPRAARSCPDSCTCIRRCFDMRRIAGHAPLAYLNIKARSYTLSHGPAPPALVRAGLQSNYQFLGVRRSRPPM